MKKAKRAKYWIEKLGLKKHIEGGYFRETYRSDEKISRGALPRRFSGERAFSTAIYFLLEGSEFSALHRLKQDEVWHFYEGSALEIHRFDKQGKYSRIILGREIENGEVLQSVVDAGCWFGAALNDKSTFALVGCTVAPGFDFSDFESAKRSELLSQFPEHKDIIEGLTR